MSEMTQSKIGDNSNIEDILNDIQQEAIQKFDESVNESVEQKNNYNIKKDPETFKNIKTMWNEDKSNTVVTAKTKYKSTNSDNYKNVKNMWQSRIDVGNNPPKKERIKHIVKKSDLMNKFLNTYN